MTSITPEDRERRLRSARAVSWISLGAVLAVAVVTVVLLTSGTAGRWLLLVDLLAAFVAVRSMLRLVAIGRALRE